MPISVLMDFKFQQEETLNRLMNQGPVWDYLATRWLTNAPGNQERIFWDLALVEAVARPSLATQEQRLAPPENEQRMVHVYTAVDAEAMIADWWNTVDK